MLSVDELRVIDLLLGDHIAWAEREMSKRLVSESIIRTKRDAEDARAKIREVLR